MYLWTLSERTIKKLLGVAVDEVPGLRLGDNYLPNCHLGR